MHEAGKHTHTIKVKAHHNKR